MQSRVPVFTCSVSHSSNYVIVCALMRVGSKCEHRRMSGVTGADAVSNVVLCAVIDWQRGWCKAVGNSDLGRLSNAQWLMAWVNEGLNEMEDTGGLVDVIVEVVVVVVLLLV